MYSRLEPSVSVRNLNRSRTNFKYTKRYGSNCFYCNVPNPETEDHVIPVSSTLHVPGMMFTVPCCRDCNNQLSNALFFKLSERAKYLLPKIKPKKKAAVIWTEEELEELGPGLRAQVEDNLKRDRRAISRYDFLSNKIKLLEKAEETK